MQTLNYNVLNVLKSYLPNKTFNNVSATCNNICYTPITQTEIQCRVCGVYLGMRVHICYRHIKCVIYMFKKYNMNLYIFYIYKWSAESGYLDVMKYLIEEEKFKNYRINDNYALRLSAKNGHLHIVKYLIEEIGLDEKDLRILHNWILFQCARNGQLNMIKYVLKTGLTVKDVRWGNNAILRISVKNGHLHVVKYLIEEVGLTLKDVRSMGDEVLQSCAIYGHLHILEYLVEIGFTIDDIRRDNFVLKYSIRNNHLDIVKYLIKLGVTKEDVINVMEDPELWYVFRLHNEMSNYLLEINK